MAQIKIVIEKDIINGSVNLVGLTPEELLKVYFALMDIAKGTLSLIVKESGCVLPLLVEHSDFLRRFQNSLRAAGGEIRKKTFYQEDMN